MSDAIETTDHAGGQYVARAAYDQQLADNQALRTQIATLQAENETLKDALQALFAHTAPVLGLGLSQQQQHVVLQGVSQDRRAEEKQLPLTQIWFLQKITGVALVDDWHVSTARVQLYRVLRTPISAESAALQPQQQQQAHQQQQQQQQQQQKSRWDQGGTYAASTATQQQQPPWNQIQHQHQDQSQHQQQSRWDQGTQAGSTAIQQPQQQQQVYQPQHQFQEQQVPQQLQQPLGDLEGACADPPATQPLFRPYDALQLASHHALWTPDSLQPSFKLIDSLINSKSAADRIFAIQDSASVKAMCAGFRKRPKGWTNTECKLVTFHDLMRLTVKVIRNLRLIAAGSGGHKRPRSEAGEEAALPNMGYAGSSAGAFTGQPAAAPAAVDAAGQLHGQSGGQAEESEGSMLQRVAAVYAWAADIATAADPIECWTDPIR